MLPALIQLITSDDELSQLVRDTGMACSALAREALPAIAQPGAVQPEVLIADLRGHEGMPPSIAALRRNHPGTGVLLVVSKLDPAQMLAAMRAGVNECIAEPVSLADLTGGHQAAGGKSGAGHPRRDVRLHRREGGRRRHDCRGEHRDRAGPRESGLDTPHRPERVPGAMRRSSWAPSHAFPSRTRSRTFAGSTPRS